MHFVPKIKQDQMVRWLLINCKEFWTKRGRSNLGTILEIVSRCCCPPRKPRCDRHCASQDSNRTPHEGIRKACVTCANLLGKPLPLSFIWGQRYGKSSRIIRFSINKYRLNAKMVKATNNFHKIYLILSLWNYLNPLKPKYPEGMNLPIKLRVSEAMCSRY